MVTTLTITTTLQPRGPATAIVLTDEQVAELGGGTKAFQVTVTITGASHQLRLARMGGESLIGFSKAARTAAGVEVGDTVVVEISADTGERTIKVPDDLAAALAAGAATATFDHLAPSHRKEYVRWVTEAKKEQTRADRIAKAVAMVQAGQTR